MAVSIYRDDNLVYKINGNSEPSGVYRVLYSRNNTYITIVHPEQGNRPLFTRTLITEVQKADGTTYSGFSELDTELRDFFVNAGGSNEIRYTFESSAARDTFFSTRLNLLFPGLNIITAGDVEVWTGERDPDTYDNTNWHETGVQLTAQEVKTLYESNANTNALTDDKNTILGYLSEEPSGEIRSTRSFIFPPGSIAVGDAIIESGARVITARSAATGRTGAFLIQLFDDDGYDVATMYDYNQQPMEDDIQVVFTDQVSGTTETDFTITIDADIQLKSVRFRPEGGTITQPFTFELMIRGGIEPTYLETIPVNSPFLEDIGGGIWSLKLQNPSQFDQGTVVDVTFEGISVEGGNGFTGIDPLPSQIVGDPAKNHFFPWLRSIDIPIFRLPLATQAYVQGLITTGITISNFRVTDIANRIDLNTDINGSHSFTANIVNHSAITTLEILLNGTVVQTVTNPTADGAYSGTFTLSGQDTSTEQTLRFTLRANNSVMSNMYTVSVRNLPQAETVYTGVSDSNNPGTVDVSTLTAHEISADTTFESNFTLDPNDWAIILYPNNYTITHIEEESFRQQILTDFTATSDVRTIGSITYNSLVHQNQSNVQGVLATNITVEV